MNKNKTQITLVRNPNDHTYDKKQAYDLEEKLVLLWMLFDSYIRYNPVDFSNVKNNIIERNVIGENVIGATFVDGKWQIYCELWDDIYEPRLSTDELLELIHTWYDLIIKKVEKIVMTYENGKYSISSE